MKLSKVVATDIQTNKKQVFTFDTAAGGKRIITSRGGKLNNYLEFCFRDDVECVKDVEVEFVINKEVYSLARLHNDDGTLRSILKKMVDGHWQVVARNKSISYIEGIINEQLADLLRVDYINNKAIAAFGGDLKLFDGIRMLSEVQESVNRSVLEAKALKQSALSRVKHYSGVSDITTQGLDQITAELSDVNHALAEATAQLAELKAKQAKDGIRGDITTELQTAQTKYNALIARRDEMEMIRSRVKLRDDIQQLIPKLRNLHAIAQQRTINEKKRYAFTTELEYQENELVSITQQLENKHREIASTQDKRNRIEGINGELSYIASLYEKNKQLNETLLDLNDQQQRLISEKVMYADKLSVVERSINEVRESLDQFHIPAKSVGELLETVRVDVKIEEVKAQVEKLQSEIAIKESQIAEKESSLVVLLKRFRSVAELDVAVTPIKAKDTITQVLDVKYNKLETVNQSLTEKLRNFERALEDYKYQILHLEQSRSALEGQLEKTLLRKQEEFKREVYLNSQRVYSDDASSVFAVQSNFHDQEIEQLEQEITARNMDRDLLMERAFQLEGSIKEIKRHIEINNAEMETLQREKTNIQARYSEIVAQNSSEAVFNYLKALTSDNGTRYLLDCQQDAVRCESELTELKRSIEVLRNKLTTLKARLKYLVDTQKQLEGSQNTVDTLVVTNDKLKDELADIGDRLAAGYEQYKAISRNLEAIESKLEDVRGAIVEISKTIKVNELQITEATERAKKLAGSEDIEQAIAGFRYDLGDVESERQMLAESKAILEREVFKKRLELEKSQWLYDAKNKEYNQAYSELQSDLSVMGLSLEALASLNLDENVETYRGLLARYDTARAALADKIENLNNILSSQPTMVIPARDIEQKEREVEALNQRVVVLEEKRQKQLALYVLSSKARMRVTAAAAEARVLNNMSASIGHNSIVGVLINDKIKTLLEKASKYLNALTDGKYSLEHDNYKVVVVDGENKIYYENLPEELKTALYISIILSVPNTDTSEGRWLIFEERIAIDRKLLSDMLLNIDNVSYVVDYTRD